jgi:tellurite resistance protein TerC
MLAIDLFLHRDNHVIGFREAAVWSAVWIGAGLAFGLLLWWWQGSDVAGTYYAGYLIEKALSIDNVFVFALIFTSFAVPAALQHKVLFWGVIGALIFRLVFIFVGAELLETFFWTAYVFGAFLIYAAVKLLMEGETDEDDFREGWVLRRVRRLLPTSPAYDGSRLVTRSAGRRLATPLVLVIAAIGIANVVFALDSIPAIFGLTTSAYIVFTANAFALMGLRQLYFMVGGLLDRIVYLNIGLSVILGFIGAKLVVEALEGSHVEHIGAVPLPHIGILFSLGFIAATLGVTTLASLVRTSRDDPTAA